MKMTNAMLADAAVVQDSKLYIHGGGWNQLFAGSFPVVHPALTLTWTLEVPWDEITDEINLGIDLVDEDDTSIIPLIEGVVVTSTGPGAKRGDAVVVPGCLTLNQIKFDNAGGYRFRFYSNGKLLRHLSFRVAKLPGAK